MKNQENGEGYEECMINGKKVCVHYTYYGLTEKVKDDFNKLLADAMIEDYKAKTDDKTDVGGIS